MPAIYVAPKTLTVPNFMIDLVQYRFRIGTYTGMRAKGTGRLNSGQFHDSSVFNPYNTSESL